MLSRLISLLSRIPAVKWAFTRLRPLPHTGSIEAAAIAADASPAIIAEAAPARDSIGAEPMPRDADGEVAVPVDEEHAATVVEDVSISLVEVASEPPDAAELISSDLPVGLMMDVEPDVVDEAPGSSTAGHAPLAAVVAEDATAGAPVVAMHVEPAPASPAPKSPRAPKARAKIAEPADRATLIRQRWAETGTRMWNPRLHGAGDATLNIQGRIELLPPEPGEMMPRYDKLEFKLLGGQIVCEGVVVEAPVHASQRSFTRLAEPRSAECTREPVRERQAALA